MKTSFRALFALAVLALAGCTSAPVVTREQVAAADVGPQPGETERATILAALQLILKDPTSAEYKWGEPFKSALRTGGRADFGWEIPVLINAKNGYGAYIGFQPWSFFLINGRVASYQDPQMAKFGFWTPIKP